MVKKYADLYLEARRALMTQEDAQTASLMARNLIALYSGQTQEYILSNRELYASEETCEKTDKAVKRQPVRNKETKVGPNDPCPCGSGKKYKKCCMQKDKAAGME